MKNSQVLCLIFLFISTITLAVATCPSYITVFGDSLSDTGNFDLLTHMLRLPYGETYFKKPAGRFSNGRVWLDFFVKDFMGETRFLNPYLKLVNGTNLDYKKGVNFAFVGATATQDPINAFPIASGFYLDVQVQQFHNFTKMLTHRGSSHLPSKKDLQNNLAIILSGGNDINYATVANMSREYITKTLIPEVISVIGDAAKKLDSAGVQTILFINLPPQGCSTLYLQHAEQLQLTDYDELGCNIGYNEVTRLYNTQLQQLVKTLKTTAKARLVYGDQYSVAMELYKNPAKYKFDKKNMLNACCGNKTSSYNCGTGGVLCDCGNGGFVCKSPNSFMMWDGAHYTEGYNHHFTKLMLYGKKTSKEFVNYLHPSDAFHGCLKPEHRKSL